MAVKKTDKVVSNDSLSNSEKKKALELLKTSARKQWRK